MQAVEIYSEDDEDDIIQTQPDNDDELKFDEEAFNRGPSSILKKPDDNEESKGCDNLADLNNRV